MDPVWFSQMFTTRSAIGRKSEYRSTNVYKGATLGANCTIICGINLGHDCFIGAGTLVNKDVKPYALVVGNPGKQIGWMSSYGERIPLPIEGYGEWKCPKTNKIYKLENKELKIF